MDIIVRCQSCGMPLDDEFFGTEENGELTPEFCKFCYQDGSYVQPDVTMESMIRMSVDNMTAELGFDDPKAIELANAYIPTLKRWKKEQ